MITARREIMQGELGGRRWTEEWRNGDRTVRNAFDGVVVEGVEPLGAHGAEEDVALDLVGVGRLDVEHLLDVVGGVGAVARGLLSLLVVLVLGV